MNDPFEVFLRHVVLKYDEKSDEDKAFYRDVWATAYRETIDAYEAAIANH